MSEIYKGMPGSPITYLASDISAGQTTISVADDTALPDAPNLCTIGYGEEIETIKYGTKSNGVLQNVTRGIEGAPRAWQAGTEVARFFTAYDHDAIAEALGKNPIWFADYEEWPDELRVFKNLFGDGSKIHASEIEVGSKGNQLTLEEFAGGGTPVALTLQNGWTGNLYVKKSRWGHVTIYGEITPGTTTAATVIAGIPDEYRGVQITSVPAYVASAGLRNSLGLVITLNGTLSIYEPLSNVLGTSRIEINYVYQAI